MARVSQKRSRVIPAAVPRKTAMDKLLASADEMAVAASKRASTAEVRRLRQQINDVVDRAVSRKPRRETA